MARNKSSEMTCMSLSFYTLKHGLLTAVQLLIGAIEGTADTFRKLAIDFNFAIK